MTTQEQAKVQPHLNGHHQRTYEAIFRHPTAHNLEWHDARSLLAALADVAEGDNGTLKVTRNGHAATWHAHHNKDVASVEEVLAIRRFLETSGEIAGPPPPATGVQLLVVIDHHEAKVYRTESHGAVAQRIVPYDPRGFGRHLRSENPETDGKRQPERKSFFEAVAATLRGADAIVIFGTGTGESSAMDQLLADLKHNHHDVAEHIIGSVVVDEHHLTEGQLLAQAREIFARSPANGSSEMSIKRLDPLVAGGAK